MNDLNTATFADVSIVARYRGPTTPDVIEEQCYDISKGGMFVRSFNPLPNGTLIKFECQVDDNPNDIQGIGRVVWQRDEDCPEAPSGMGVKFLVLRPGSPEIIESVIRKAGPMPKLFESAQKKGQQRDRERAQQRTSNRAKTLVGNQASKLAIEIKRNRSAKREQLLITAKNAQKLVIEAKKEKSEKNQKQRLSQVRSAPVIAITQEDKPRDESTAVDAIGQEQERQSQTDPVKAVAQDEEQQKSATVGETGQQQERQSQTDPVKAVAQDEERQNQNEEIRTDAKTAENNTARVLELAARRAKELAEKEATMLNLEVAAESAIRTGKRGGIFSIKGLVFASVIAVILLRIGYVKYGESENQRRAEPQLSIPATAQSAAAPVGVDHKSSQEKATQALGSERPAVEPIEASKPSALAVVESSERDSLKNDIPAVPVETDRASEREARLEHRKSRFEKAAECQKRGDHKCVVRLLSNRVSSEKERLLLAQAYRSIEEKQSPLEETEKHAHGGSPVKRSAKSAKKPAARRTASGIPFNPYPE